MTARTIVAMLVLAIAGTAVLTGCGRKGPLDVPGVVDANGKPVSTTKQPPVKDRHFVLDPLIQ
ncbi:MAG TPA: lipoprotein [Pararhizobium sp.]|nr:lipoprotein [Pararhizobium sp.]